jgi:hypothetical protein
MDKAELLDLTLALPVGPLAHSFAAVLFFFLPEWGQIGHNVYFSSVFDA